MDEVILKVAHNSNPGKVAGAIAGCIRDNKNVIVRAVGTRAIVRSVYAIALATSFLNEDSEPTVLWFAIKNCSLVIEETKEINGYDFYLAQKKDKQ
jgi:stage V sporulation protein SpoVS